MRDLALWLCRVLTNLVGIWGGMGGVQSMNTFLESGMDLCVMTVAMKS